MPYSVLTTASEVEALVEDLIENDAMVYLDTETTSLNPREGKLVAIQLLQQGLDPIIIDWRHINHTFAADALSYLFERLPVVAHNMSFDWQWLAHNGMVIDHPNCTKLAEQVIYGLGDEDAKAQGKDLTLKGLVNRYCGVDLSKSEREWFYDLDQRPEWDEPFPDEEIEYMGQDILYLPRIHAEQEYKLLDRHLTRVLALELKALPAVCTMEMNGIRVDADAWRAVILKEEARARELEAKVVDAFGQAIQRVRQRRFDEAQAAYNEWEAQRDMVLECIHAFYHEGLHAASELAGKATGDAQNFLLVHKGIEPEEGEKWGTYKNRVMKAWRDGAPNPGRPKLSLEVNINSSDQLREAFVELGIPLDSTGKDLLEKAAAAHPELRLLLEYRQAQKFVTSFGEKLLAHIEADGRIHPAYQQLGTSTGRMSCRRPNWQQIPSRTDTGKALRQCVLAEPGHKLLTADYSIIELRILAEMSGDENMLAMFESGEDLHSYTARNMFGLPEDADVKAYRLPNGLKARDVAKTINYGVAYGQSAFGFAQKFNVDVETAQGFIDQYYKLYAQAGQWLKRRGNQAVSRLSSSTILGRKRYYDAPGSEPKVKWSDEWKEWSKRAGAIRRAGMNHPIQGTSADMTKLALALFYQTPTHRWKLVACVHDEIVVEVPEEDVAEASERLAAMMMKAARMLLKTVAIPPIEVHVGDSWEK